MQTGGQTDRDRHGANAGQFDSCLCEQRVSFAQLPLSGLVWHRERPELHDPGLLQQPGRENGVAVQTPGVGLVQCRNSLCGCVCVVVVVSAV